MAELDFDKDLVKMQELFSKLRHEYDLFFAGNRKDPPSRDSQNLDKIVRKWRNASLSKLVNQFRFSSFMSSYTLQVEMWSKLMRAKEEGLAKDPRLVAAVRKTKQVVRELEKGHLESQPVQELSEESQMAPAPGAGTPPPGHGPAESAAERRLFEAFISAKLEVGEIPKMDFHDFTLKLKGQRDAILQKYPDHEVSFSVAMKDGKVSLKAKVQRKAAGG